MRGGTISDINVTRVLEVTLVKAAECDYALPNDLWLNATDGAKIVNTKDHYLEGFTGHCTGAQKVKAHAGYCKAIDNDGGIWADKALALAHCTLKELKN
jgi:hypothetical protein